jgi:hypothetical protein
LRIELRGDGIAAGFYNFELDGLDNGECNLS